MATSAPARATGPTKINKATEKKALAAEKDAAPGAFIRVHSPEAILPRGRVLENWSHCTKPHTGVKGGGCRNGLMGFFVREGGVLKRVVWVGKKGVGASGECDWVEGDDEGDEGGEGEDEEGGEVDGGEE